MNIKIVGLLTLSIFSCASVTSHSDGNTTYSVESWKNESAIEFIQTLKEAKKNNEHWVATPSLWGAHLLYVSELKKFSYHYVADTIEDNTGGTITIIRDGFLDDSVRGDLHEIRIQKVKSNWEIKYIKKAFRCWRNNNTSYGVKICP